MRDNGMGMTEKMLQSGRPNHWGLCGMRERAGEISIHTRIWSREGEGCEIELTVPADVAFVSRARAATMAWTYLRLDEWVVASRLSKPDA